MTNDPLPEEWSILRDWLPPDLEKSAKCCKFVERASRKGLSVETWLRLILMHVTGLSLEQTMLRASEMDWADVSHVALFKRLCKAQRWLAELCGKLLAEQRSLLGENRPWPQGWNIRLIDATNVQEPGSTGTSWRIHYSMRMPEMVCDYYEITDEKGGEKFGRFEFEPGELVLADRGYSHRAGVAHVLESGADVIVRWNTAGFPLEDENGEPSDMLDWLKSLPARASRERKVWFRYGGKRYELRLCAVRKSKLAAETARRKARENAKARGTEIQAQTLEYAGYVLVLCSASASAIHRNTALELYRGRWQVEIAFKRLKSLLDAGHVPKENDSSARAWMQAKLLTALLIERTLWEGEFLSPWGHGIKPG